MVLQDDIDEVYVACSQGAGCATFRGIAKVFWPILDNSISLIDLAGVFTVSVPDSAPGLNIALFGEFFHGVSRIKFPNHVNYCEKLIELIKSTKQMTVLTDNPIFIKAIDREVTRVLLTFDFPLRRAFSNFAGESVKVGGGLSWEEVKKLSVGMEIEGLIAFAGAYNLIPASMNIQQCDQLGRTILNNFPLLAGNSSMQSSLLFPQFQLLLCFAAFEKYDAAFKLNQQPVNPAKPSTFARKVVAPETKSMADILSDLLKSLGIDKLTATREGPDQNKMHNSSLGKDADRSGANVFSGTVTLPAFDGVDNPANNASSSKYASARQAMLMRLDHLFEKDVENKLQETSLASSAALKMMLAPLPVESPEEMHSAKRNLLNKPVVIGDAIPVPSTGECPESVEQMLQAALAHHNLGNFEESLKFLEASRVQLFSHERMKMIKAKQKELEDQRDLELEAEAAENNGTSALNAKSNGVRITMDMIENVTVQDEEVVLPIGLEMYIVLCKGNVYQSCGDDEQALNCYLVGWSRAIEAGSKEWEVVCINSIGLIAYYNVRFEIALTCFAKVSKFRETAYGAENPDAATAWNNEAACLYCLSKRGDARVLFEKCWNVLCKALGHRHPRCVTVWKNLDKARRSQATMSSKQSMAESIKLRTDAELLIPGNFTSTAVIPDSDVAHKKKKGKKKKKK